MSMTKQELQQLAGYFADALDKRGMGGGKNNNSFLTDNSRKSRKTDSKETMISDLAEITSMTAQFAKTWKNFKRNIELSVRGNLKETERVSDAYIEAIKKATTKVSGQSKKLVDSYARLIEANKGNYKKQQDIFDAFTAYSQKVAKLNTLASAEKHTKKQREELIALNAEITDVVKILNDMGIEAKEVELRLRDKNKMEVVNKAVVTGVIEVYKNLGTATKQYSEEMQEVLEEEMDARKKMTASIGAAAAGAGQILHKAMTTVDARLQNLQTETRFGEAIMDGLSPQEQNEFMNANRNSAKLLGDAADDYQDTLGQTLREFGLFGKEAADRITALTDLQMRMGIRPTQMSAEALQVAASKLQAIEGITQSEALAKISEFGNSVEFLSYTVGKTDQERMSILQQQAVQMTRIARSTGLSAEYQLEYLKEERNKKFQSIIDKITKKALLPVYLKGVEKEMGRDLTAQEERILGRKAIGVTQSPEDAQTLVNLEKELGLARERVATQTGADIFGGNIGAATGYILPQLMAERVGDNIRGSADMGVGASAQGRTIGLAVGATDQGGLVDASRASLSNTEEFYRVGVQAFEGILKSPVGSLLSVANGLLAGILMNTGSMSIGGGRRGPKGGGRGGPRGGAGAGAGRATGALAAKGIGASGGRLLAGGAAGLGLGLLTTGITMGGDAWKQNALEGGAANNNTILDGDTGGATLSMLGSAGTGALTGAAIGSFVPVIGTAVGAAIGGIIGAGKGLYDNWDTVERNFDTVFGDVGDSAMASTDVMTSNRMLDANGNVISNPDDPSLQYNREIAENTGRLAALSEEGLALNKDAIQTRRAESVHAQRTAQHVDSLRGAHSARVTAAETAIDNSITYYNGM